MTVPNWIIYFIDAIGVFMETNDIHSFHMATKITVDKSPSPTVYLFFIFLKMFNAAMHLERLLRHKELLYTCTANTFIAIIIIGFFFLLKSMSIKVACTLQEISPIT